MALAVVTHDMGVIAALADDVVVMREGRIVERGPVARILARAGARIHASLAGRDAARGDAGRGDRDASRTVETAAAPSPLAVRQPARASPVARRLAAPRRATLAAVDGVSLRSRSRARRWASSANRAAASRR